ncbi:TRAP transporter substrate-binding protein [Acuticoccus kandeliae]|uniref:TRAP transporter substrate-binding protein n=1 Tax=Acuticoccus kandeliae TaxID=2073160 RepID=UPI0013007F5F|nr:TRAP transporter substrate-binding protein [Acuticoccus kandeliae]
MRACTFLAGAALVALTLAPLQPAAAQSVRWTMSNEYAQSSLAAQGDLEFAKRVAEATDGRVTILNQFGGASGMRSTDHFAAVEDGAIAIASTPTDKLLGIDPIFGLFSIPFLTPTVPDSKRLVALARDDMAKVFDNAGQVLLFTSPWTPSGIWAKTPITDVASLQDLKTRAFDESSALTMRNAGVSAVQLTWGDVFPALSTGMINSVLTSDETGVSTKIWEHTPVFNAAGFTIGVNLVHINKDQFEQLSAEDQAKVREIAAEVEEWAWQQGINRQQNNFATMRDNNVEVVETMAPDVMTHLQTAAAPIRDAWVEKVGADTADRILGAYEK